MSSLLRLVRFPAPLSALTDVLAGAGLAGAGLADRRLALLLGASLLLYSGGMALNDFADRARDAARRPERPIPAGALGPARAGAIGWGLLLGGVGLAGLAGVAPLFVAGAVALAVLAYDFACKDVVLAGPLGMGLCRGGNLLLGGSLALPGARGALWAGAGGLALYVVSLTGASRAEDGELPLPLAALCLAGMTAALSSPYWVGPRALPGLVALVPAAALLFLRWRDLRGAAPGRFVKWGVLGIMLLDAGFLLAANEAAAGVVCLVLYGISAAWPRARID